MLRMILCVPRIENSAVIVALADTVTVARQKVAASNRVPHECVFPGFACLLQGRDGDLKPVTAGQRGEKERDGSERKRENRDNKRKATIASCRSTLCPTRRNAHKVAIWPVVKVQNTRIPAHLPIQPPTCRIDTTRRTHNETSHRQQTVRAAAR